MRRTIVFTLLLFMTLGLFGMLLSRNRTPHDAPAEIVVVPEPKPTADGGVDAGVLADAGPVDAGKKAEPTVRMLRVVTLGWELGAPAAFLAEPDAGAAGATELAVVDRPDKVSSSLLRGATGDAHGADVAILTLPAFIGVHGAVRALDPRIFLVVGFARGREVFRAAPGALTKAFPGEAPVALVTESSPAASLVGLFALDTMGVAPERVTFVTQDAPAGAAAEFAALLEGQSDPRRLAFSMADASRLVPIVAVAPAAVLESRGAEIEGWARAWLDANGRTRKEAAEVSRRLAAKEGLTLAPESATPPDAVALLERLGRVDGVLRADEGRWLGAKATGLEPIVRRTWRLARAARMTDVAMPEKILEPKVADAVAGAGATTVAATAEGDAGTRVFAGVPVGATLLLTYRGGASVDPSQVAAEVAFLSTVFERAVFRVAAKGGEKAARAIAADVIDRHGVAPSRIAVASTEPAGASALVELLSPP